MPDKLDSLLSAFNARTANARNVIANLQERLAKDPAYAMQWSLNAFDAAAVLEVGGCVLGALEHAATESNTTELQLERLRDRAQHEVVSRAQSCAESSSATANLMARAILREWANALDMLSPM